MVKLRAAHPIDTTRDRARSQGLDSAKPGKATLILEMRETRELMLSIWAKSQRFVVMIVTIYRAFLCE